MQQRLQIAILTLDHHYAGGLFLWKEKPRV